MPRAKARAAAQAAGPAPRGDAWMRGADQVAVDGVTSRTTSRLDLHQDAQLVVDGVDLIGDPLAPLVAQVDWPPDLLGAMLAALYLVADLEQSGPQVGQDLSLASPSTVAESIKGGLRLPLPGARGPVGGARAARVVEPLRIAVGSVISRFHQTPQRWILFRGRLWVFQNYQTNLLQQFSEPNVLDLYCHP
jgi:hypothetical protein